MSSKTRTRKTRTTATTGNVRALRSVPDQPTIATVRTDSEDKLWAVLYSNPNSTAAELSAAAKIGKSTAQKILVKWASDGSVMRTAGITEGGRRAADLWAIAEAGTESDRTNVDNLHVDAPADETPVEDAGSADIATTEASIVSETPGKTDIDAAMTAGDINESVETGPTVTADDAQDATDSGAPKAASEMTEPADTEPPVTRAAEPADGETTVDDAAPDSGENGKGERLAPGALRGMVEDYLRDHPREEFGPTAIAKALGGKSSGAVSNTLDKLIADGIAVKTKDKPRRFALGPVEQEATSALAN